MNGLGKSLAIFLVATLAALATGAAAEELRGTGDLGIVVERAAGAIQIIDTSQKKAIARVDGLGDLSHASAVFLARWPLRLRLRPRRGPQQNRSPYRDRRQTCRAGWQLDRRRDFRGRPAGRGLQLRAGRREGFR